MKITELFRFTQGSSVITMTSGKNDVVYSAETYVATPIGRSGIELKNELSKANIDVKLPLKHSQSIEWMRASSEFRIGLTIFQQTDLDTNVIWKGRMAAVKPGVSDVIFQFESIHTSMKRPGLRARYQRPCRHALYQRGCRLDKDDFGVTYSATAVAGNVVTVPGAAAAPAGDFFTGMLEAPDGTFRFIVGHSGSAITLQRPIVSLNDALASGPVNVTLYPGCDRTTARCIARFNNLPNFGGFKYIPIINPFGGSPIV